ncbi:50S ribosomal protein L11 methyltransferase [Bartonella sp. TP]|uniref:50S ribosomal protein L11 methyltransferase n=1 Tax=Bartonella sp. TP TaxID=3057550 RepID=UPI0025AFA2ED|nr:50S ribosomal protein L11 methyltransferase [Bartonella sp. TP]WJW79775.1 50S ribosomal protein L11 methyltransferase [Bartonella sp. TP]
MQQARLYSEIQGPAAKEYFDKLTQLFEEEGLPVAIVEICDSKQLYEISLYTNETELELVKQKMLQLQLTLHLAIIVQIEILPDIDWVKHSLQGLKPVETEAFFIYGEHQRDKIPPHKLPIEIEAGQAFGTGHHATTVDCLKFLEYSIPVVKPEKILDIGTGSGILSIAAAKLAKKLNIHTQITANDIDPVAVKVALENIELNNVKSSIRIYHADEQDIIKNAAPFNLIVANILASPLIHLAPTISNIIAPNGALILSGILISQAEKIVEIYKQHGFALESQLYTTEWASLYFRTISQKNEANDVSVLFH